MTKVQCKILDLLKVCNLVGVQGLVKGQGAYLVEDFLIKAEGGKLIVRAGGTESVLFASLSYKASVIEEGNIAIRSIKEFDSYLKTFNPNDVVLLLSDNKRVSIERKKPRKVVSFPSTKSSLVNSLKHVDDFEKMLIHEGNSWKTQKGTEFNCRVELDSEYMRQVLNDASVVGKNRVPLEVKDGKLIVKLGDTTSGLIESEIITDSIEGEAVAEYARGFDAIFKAISGKVKISFTSNAPMIVEKKEEDYDLMYFLAPIVEEVI